MNRDPFAALFHPFVTGALDLPAAGSRALFLGAEPGFRLPQGFDDAGAQLMTEPVDRRIRQRDDRDAVLGAVLGLGHVCLNK